MHLPVLSLGVGTTCSCYEHHEAGLGAALLYFKATALLQKEVY